MPVYWMEDAEMWLCETSRVVSRGRGVVARVMLCENQSPLVSLVRERGFEPSASNSARKGREVKSLCDKLRVVRFGSAKRLVGSTVRVLRERSRLVRAVRSANESGKLASLLLWSLEKT